MEQTIREIAEIYIKAVEAKDRAWGSTTGEGWEDVNSLFTEAEQKLNALIGAQVAELLALRDAAVQGDIPETKSRYEQLINK